MQQFLRIAAIAVSLFVASASAVLAGEPRAAATSASVSTSTSTSASTSASETTPTAVPPPIKAGGAQRAMRIYRDPATGELSSEPIARGPQAETIAAPAIVGPDYNTVILEAQPDGSVNAVARDGQFHSSVRVRVTADGALATTCVHGVAGHAHDGAESN